MPLKPRKHLPAYPDGIVEIYDNVASKNNVGASRNPTSLDDLSLFCTLCFSEESMRERDQELANQIGIKVTLKVRTPYLQGVTVKQVAVIGSRLYDIVRVDPQKQTQLFIYLSGGRLLDGKDPHGEDQGGSEQG